MKRKITHFYRIFWAVMVCYLFFAFSSNPPNGSQSYTGAPPNMNTCSSGQGGCHSGGTGTGNVMITGLPATIMPSTLYPITVSINRTNSTPQRGGFQMTVLDASNNFAGTLSNAGASSNIEGVGSLFVHEHGPAKFFGGNTITYTVDWTSPATGSGDITMYAAAVLGNNSSGSSGDPVVTTTAAGAFQGGGGLITVDVTGNDVLCFGENTGSATASPSGGGGGPYFYSWSNGGSMQMINNLSAGMYTVTVSNGTGGMGTGSVMISQPATAVSSSIINQTNITCASPTGSATAQGSGGTPGWTYVWSNGNMGPSAIFSAGGTYTVTVSDVNQCTSTSIVEIEADIVPPTAEAGPTAELDCSNTSVMLNGSGSSVGPGITYNWMTTNGQILNGANTLFPEVGAAGTYVLTVIDNNNGCTESDDVEVTENSNIPTASAGDDMELTCSTSSATLDGSGSSAGTDITYLWTTSNGNIVSGETTLSPEVNAAGIYTLTVSNTANGCSESDEVVVTANTMMPTADAGPGMVITCLSSMLTLDGSGSSMGNFSYLWTTTDGIITSGETTLMPTVGAPGTYCLTVTDLSNGCTATDCTIVDDDTVTPIAEAGNGATLTCSTTSVILDGTGSSTGAIFSYEWTTAGGNIVSGEHTLMPTVDEPGTYTITVTNDNNGCSTTDDVIVNEDINTPTADAGPSMALNCNNSSVVLDGSGSSQGTNIVYEWSGPGIQSGGITTTPTVNVAGTYTIVVTDTNSGCISENSTMVTLSPAVNATISSQTNLQCNGDPQGSATAEGSGGNGIYTFAWSNGETTAMITGLSANIYTVTVTDGEGCTATAMATITEPEILLVNASATAETSSGANDGTATSNPEGGTGGYSFSWSNGETTQSISNLPTGNYTVTVTDANMCTAEETVTVASSGCANFTVDFSVTEPDCNGAATGSATAMPMNGTPPYIFAWSNGSMEATASSLEAGTYTVTVMDVNGCEVTGNVTLSEPPELSLTVGSTTNVLCHGEANGSASLVVFGGTPTHTFLWDDGSTDPDRDDLAAGAYEPTVTDMNGCTTSTQLTISEPSFFMVIVNTTDESSPGASDGTATASPMGGIGAPYTFDWNTGHTGATIEDLPPGEYCVTVTDGNGCTAENCGTVNQPGCGGTSIVVNGTNVSCFGLADGTANVEASGFTDPITYMWSNGASEDNITMLMPGTYTVTVSDDDGCSAIDMIVINEPDELIIELIDLENLTCAGDMSGSISVQAEGGTSDYTYVWSNDESTPTISGLDDGFYEVTVIDDNDCMTTLEVEVGVDPDTEFPVVVTQNITVSLDENGMVSITADQVDGGSTDNCGVAELVIDIFDFTCDDIGENEVVLAVADAANNCSSGTAIVTVVDDMSPVLDCSDDFTVVVNSCSGVVEYPEPTAEDNCGGVTIDLAAGLPSGDVFPAGETAIAWTAIDDNGNTAACSFVVTVEIGFAAEAIFTQPTCPGEEDGTATANPVNGIMPFTYMWDDPAGQTDQTAIGLSANTYTCTVTDAEGCTATVTVEVTDPPVIEITVDDIINATGTNMDGAISVSVANGVGDLTYEWTLLDVIVSTEEDPTGLAAGDYLLLVTDDNGCTAEIMVTVDMLSSAHDAGLALRISVFPNPVSSSVNVHFELPQTMAVQLTMLDLTGRKVLPERQEALTERTIKLDVNDLSSGVYFLRMVVDESVVVKRVVVK